MAEELAKSQKNPSTTIIFHYFNFMNPIVITRHNYGDRTHCKVLSDSSNHEKFYANEKCSEMTSLITSFKAMNSESHQAQNHVERTRKSFHRLCPENWFYNITVPDWITSIFYTFASRFVRFAKLR